MLIVNADDWGMNRTSTDNSLSCFLNSRITSVSAMVFMADSERAADLAREYGLDTGLHLNFTRPFDMAGVSRRLTESQVRIGAFLRKSRYAALLYNPLLRRDFEYCFKAQQEEYERLYDGRPTHVDGHHHMHLCTNMLVARLIPAGWTVRRSFTFAPGEKSMVNRLYRNAVDAIIRRRYTCTDFFFSLQPKAGSERLRSVAALAKSGNVELMVHPERQEDFAYLMTPEFRRIVSDAAAVGYGWLKQQDRHA